MDQSALVTRLGFTVVAACSAESMTYPIDIIKTRLQLQGELQGRQQASKALGAGRVAAGIVKNEGLKGLYAGLGPAVVRHVFYSGTRITVYESARAKIAAAGAGSSTSGSIATSLLLGLTAGGVGQLVAVPADLVKVRMQADGRLVAMGQIAAPRYQVTLVNLGELATYDQRPGCSCSEHSRGRHQNTNNEPGPHKATLQRHGGLLRAICQGRRPASHVERILPHLGATGTMAAHVLGDV
ncbi:mitochondrial carrier domain-containing protein [Dunaliella salina]|uniref:Mitochondrial carrier domain-containing protein n=1 Tax=Dunaliella salina TaxID=3046 RepID=A0ABQ7G0C8_DUNSA|nr:mitochondrial carrier domain-containing protein [Dunaliella salina]|eukprot:KAF5828057.1 mitochondrial carrier domain-containing protein [Dunaliella salina]